MGKPTKKSSKTAPEPKKKIRVLAWSDFVCHTGFGHVADNLYSAMHDSGDYDLKVVGINYLGQKNHGYPFFAYPTDTQDRMGFNRVIDAINDIKPRNLDLLFLFQDIWNIKYVVNRINQQKELVLDLIRKQNPNLKVAIYFPLDSIPYNDHWIKTLTLVDVVITYTKWAADHIKGVLKTHNIDNVEVYSIPHAINKDNFYLLDQSKRDFYRRKRGWANKFVAFTINRFQPRKNFASMLRAMGLFLGGYKVCECGNYYSIKLNRCDLNRCSSDKVLQVNKGKDDVHYYLHCEWSNYAMGGGLRGMPEFDLPSTLRSANFDYDQINSHVEILEPDAYDIGKINLKELNQIYNAGDVFVTTTFGEGWGLTPAEALATGTPVIAPNNTAFPEVTGGNATLVNNVGFTFLPSDQNYLRPLVSVEGVVDALEKEYQRWLKNNRKKIIAEKAIDYATRFTWNDVFKQFDRLFKKAVEGDDEKTEPKQGKSS